MTKISITGATGFVGSALFENLNSKKNYLVHISARINQEKLFQGGKTFNNREILGCSSALSLDESLKKTVRWY